MAYSYARYIGDGETTTFAITFPYLSKTHVKAYVDGEEVEFEFSTPFEAVITPAPPEGAIVSIQRETPKDRQVRFTDGSLLHEGTLNHEGDQTFYVVQEVLDESEDVLKLDEADTYNAEGKRISNVGTPQGPSDAVPHSYVGRYVTDARAARDEAKTYRDSAKQSAQDAKDSAEHVDSVLDILMDSLIVDHNLDVANPPTGWYVRWENGFQVFWYELQIPQSGSGWHVHEGSYEWFPPVSFTGIRMAFGTAANTDANPASDPNVFENDKTIVRRHGTPFRAVWRATVFGNNNVRLSLFGIGRWK